MPDGPAAAMPDELTEPGRATPARASSFLIENLLAAEAKGSGRAAQGDGVREEEEEDDDDPEDEDPSRPDDDDYSGGDSSAQAAGRAERRGPERWA